MVSITDCKPLEGWIAADGANESVAPVAVAGNGAASVMGFGFD